MDTLVSTSFVELSTQSQAGLSLSRRMKFLSLNVGLLDLQVAGLRLVPTPFLEERVGALVETLLTSDADVIALQEIYSYTHKLFLIERLHEVFAHTYFDPMQRRFSLDNGLLLLSRHPIKNPILRHYRYKTWEERLLSTKGFLLCTIQLPEEQEILILNTHMTAGGATNPQGQRACRVRQSQAKEILYTFGQMPNKESILIGDFNCGPYVDAETFNMFLADFVSPTPVPLETWDAENILNQMGPYASEHHPSQAIDHILLSKALHEKCTIHDTRLMYNEPTVYIETLDKKVTLSDHYGIQIELEL